jgi:hypothetical protein
MTSRPQQWCDVECRPPAPWDHFERFLPGARRQATVEHDNCPISPGALLPWRYLIKYPAAAWSAFVGLAWRLKPVLALAVSIWRNSSSAGRHDRRRPLFLRALPRVPAALRVGAGTCTSPWSDVPATNMLLIVRCVHEGAVAGRVSASVRRRGVPRLRPRRQRMTGMRRGMADCEAWPPAARTSPEYLGSPASPP